MHNKNKTNLKEQLVWLIDLWLSKQADYEELNFFLNHEFHAEEFSNHLEGKIIKKLCALEKDFRKQTYTRQRYARDGFYNSESYQEQKTKTDERYKVHKVSY